MLAGLMQKFGAVAVIEREPEKIVIHRIGVHDALGAARLGDGELLPKPVGQSRDDLVLHVKEVGDRLVEAFAPQVASRPGVDKLHAHAHARAAALDASLEHVADVEVAADLSHVDGFALVGEGGVAGDDERPRNAGEIARQALRDPVHEMVLLGAAAEVQERQHDDGEPGRGFRRRRSALGVDWPSTARAKTRIGSAMFFRGMGPRSSAGRSIRPLT